MDFLHSLFNTTITDKQFFLLAGPCVVESNEIQFETAETLQVLCKKYDIPFVFKSSYKKANRSSATSFTGIGNTEALEILQQVKNKYKVPIVTDIHTSEEAAFAAEVADILQIPAFLCRQTDLLVAAANTNKIVNIKKGQFLNAEAMEYAIKKVSNIGNEKIMLTERGTTFGYQDLIVDFRSIPIMQQFGKPVVMDCTHALQIPNQANGITSGKPQYIETIAKCAIAAGANGLFIETHPNPSKALSDGANMLALKDVEPLLEKLVRIKQAL